MSCSLAYLLELRLRVRRSPEARAIVDRCLQLVARVEAAEVHELPALQAEVRRLEDDLALRFGAPQSALLQ